MASTIGSTPSVLTCSKANLPHPNLKKAPKMFTGRHNDIELFLREFEEMTNLYNVPTLEQFDLITCYVSHRVSKVIEGLTEYHSKNWQDFITQMKKLYNHAKTEKRYTQRDLNSFIAHKTHKFIHDLLNFQKYQHGFIRIGGWL